MPKCHVNSEETVQMADNGSIIFLLTCIFVVFIAHNCILSHNSPCWRKIWMFLLQIM